MIVRYRSMAADRVRIDAFRRAIRSVVRPGDVVVDLGTGLGTYAVFACQAGARRVYAIERDDIILAAAEIAKRNGCADRIVFVRGDALSVRLPERADVVVTEDFSPTFADGETEQLLFRARRRFLKPAGRVIPQQVTIFAAPAHCPALYARIDQWSASHDVAYSVDFSPSREMAVNCVHKAELRAADLVAPAKDAHSVNLAQPSVFPFDRSLRFRARKSTLVHGIAVWFEARLAPRVRLTNAPGSPPTLWGQAFLPLRAPIPVRRRSLVAVDLAVRFSRDSRRAWWQWEVHAGGHTTDGSTFRSFPTSLGDLEAGARDRRPGLSPHGEHTACVLQMLKAGSTILESARELRRRFPARFVCLRDAVCRAAADARRYGRLPEVRGDLP